MEGLLYLEQSFSYWGLYFKMGYDLTDKEVKWVQEIDARTRMDLKDRKKKVDEDTLLTATIFAVTYFTRKLKLVKK